MQASFDRPKPKIFDEFALTDRVIIVTGGNGGLGLEMVLALSLGRMALTREYIDKMGSSRLEYLAADITNRKRCGTEEFKKVLAVSTNGGLFTAQAAGLQMRHFGNGG
ncbi:hypothetical protein C8J56DRAFT_1057098 [Mycena floridula]|nr:hypothetical protein C8J56DRAFT_1057098 [Mycena floridula]